MTKTLSSKLQYISFFSMVLVVFIHSTNTNSISTFAGIIENFIADGIARIAVPLFFCISGYLFFLTIEATPSFFLSKFKKRISTLLFPYLFWSAWGLLLFFTLQSLPFTHSFFNNSLIKDYSAGKLLYTFFFDPLTYQLWFLRDLILLILLSPLIYLLLVYLQVLPVLIFLLIWLLNLNLILFSPESIFFFMVGSYLSLYPFQSFRQHPNAWLLLVLWLSILVLKTYLQIDDQYNVLFINVLKKAGILTGVYTIWHLYDEFRPESQKTVIKNESSWLTFSFFLYVFHEPMLTIFKKLFLYFTGINNLSLAAAFFIVPVLTIFISVSTGKLIKKKFPSFYSFITGGR